MQSKSGRPISITYADPERFNLTTVVANPRTLTVHDVEAACQNIRIDSAKGLPLDVLSLVSFIFNGYFPQAYRSGLYNQQKSLWESIASIASARVDVVRGGILIKLVKQPAYDIELYSQNGELLVLARLIKRQRRQDFEGRSIGYLNSFVKKLNKVKVASPSLRGSFICVPAPAPQGLIDKAAAITGASDPVRRFESRLPAPTDIPLNLVSMRFSEKLSDDSDKPETVLNSSEESQTNLETKSQEPELHPVELILPDLTVKRKR